MHILKQSTGVDVRVGPFMDAADGVTPETTVALGTADQAELLKHDGAATVDISSNTWAAVTGSDGWYDLTLTTTDTNTVGMVTVVVQDSSLCTPVFAHFQVVEEAVYDALFGSSAAGPLLASTTGTGLTAIPWNASWDTEVESECTDAITAASLATAAALTTVDTVVDGIQTDLDNATDGLGALKTAIDAKASQTSVDTVDSNVDAILLDTGTDGVVIAAAQTVATVTDVTNAVSANVTQISGDATAADNLEASLETMLVGTATGGVATTATVTSALTGYGDDTFIGRIMLMRTGTLQYEAATITDYDSTTGTFTFTANAWTVDPTTETFVIV